MTSALDWDNMPPDGWTTDDLDALPEDGRRRELLDGVMIVSPSPSNVHQTIAARLMVLLSEDCPPEYDVTQGVEVRINRRRSFIPDVLVTTAQAAERGPSKFEPHEVVLAVEITSPSSTSMDRVVKPALYATADIPLYWRLEFDDGALTAYTHRIGPDEGVYVPTGRFTQELSVDQPWATRIELNDLLPRFLRHPPATG